MKLTVDDLEKVIRLTGAEDSSGLRMALAHVLIDIWDTGYKAAIADLKQAEEDSILPYAPTCPYKSMAHTREWCGYDDCRES